jgi:tRNA dimethylallyltransferase
MRMGLRRAVLIAGPTASGKSALALRMAREQGGVVINADAMQVYDVLRVLTARPSPDEMVLVPHRLYGVVPPAQRFSTGSYLRAATEVLGELAPDAVPVFVGGTGLYFEALINGVAEVPEVSPALVLEVQREIMQLDGAQRLQLLAREDPATAERLGVADPQRLVRALAVKRATGRALSDYFARAIPGPLADYALNKIIMEPPRPVVRRRIAERFERMIDTGAVAEVEALLALGLDPGLPAMKAIGVREIGDWLAGRLDRDAAIARAVTATHQYAKRQSTWLRNRMADWRRIEA